MIDCAVPFVSDTSVCDTSQFLGDGERFYAGVVSWSYVYCDSCSPVLFCCDLFSAAINTNDVDYVTSRYPYKSCSRVFRSYLFHPCNLVPRFPVLRFPFPPFQSPLLNNVDSTCFFSDTAELIL